MGLIASIWIDQYGDTLILIDGDIQYLELYLSQSSPHQFPFLIGIPPRLDSQCFIEPYHSYFKISLSILNVRKKYF